MCKWVPTNLLLGVTIPIRGKRKCSSLLKLGLLETLEKIASRSGSLWAFSAIVSHTYRTNLIARVKFFLRNPRPRGTSHHLSKNAQKTANDWLTTPIYHYDNKITRSPKGGWVEDLDSTHIFSGGYGRHREMERFSAWAVTGGTGVIGLMFNAIFPCLFSPMKWFS